MGRKIAGAACDVSYVIYLLSGAFRALGSYDREPARPIGQVAKTLAITAALVQALKLIVPERRPDTGQRGSFPSGHTANTFAVATTCSAQRPAQAPGWYAAALGISLARLALKRHRLRDVIAGGLLGFAVARGVVASRKPLTP
jgi:membrane-associated phospholipid phosphatase